MPLVNIYKAQGIHYIATIFIDTMQGEMGHPGHRGPKGAPGKKGFPGPKGHPGIAGHTGEQVNHPLHVCDWVQKLIINLLTSICTNICDFEYKHFSIPTYLYMLTG